MTHVLWQRGQRLVTFAIVGIVATLLYFLLAMLAVRVLGLAVPSGSILAYMLASIWSYLAHGRLTFKTALPHRVAIPRFLQLAILGYALSAFMPWLLTTRLDVPDWMAIALTSVAVPAINMVVMSTYVFSAPLILKAGMRHGRARS